MRASVEGGSCSGSPKPSPGRVSSRRTPCAPPVSAVRRRVLRERRRRNRPRAVRPDLQLGYALEDLEGTSPARGTVWADRHQRPGAEALDIAERLPELIVLRGVFVCRSRPVLNRDQRVAAAGHRAGCARGRFPRRGRSLPQRRRRVLHRSCGPLDRTPVSAVERRKRSSGCASASHSPGIPAARMCENAASMSRSPERRPEIAST